ncbi:Calbindin-32 [Clonorchis sinensis]|uniref:Calbindin-32 n=1 Tax=Clonorchis sinensis TaxID=79923 RepID=A0A419PU40_CLOSI|nr:Calbindin-32 [Clonorchis sinensis]
MATKPHSGNYLSQFKDHNLNKMKLFTAAQFVEVWHHYDSDGNGYIEGKELDKFLREFISSVFSDELGGEVIAEDDLELMKKEFMKTFDENSDNRIELCELAKILPTEENFLVLFHQDNPLESSVEFMRIWKQFDKDRSGFIEADELKEFLRHLLKQAKPNEEIDEEKLLEYTSSILKLFDQNKDGKLQLSEMARLLPVKENYLCRPIFKNASKITSEDIDRAFSLYDVDGNNTIEDEELSGFLKDLMELAQEDYDENDLEFFKRTILSQWDVNNDGKINREELKMMLLQQSRLMSKGQKTE